MAVYIVSLALVRHPLKKEGLGVAKEYRSLLQYCLRCASGQEAAAAVVNNFPNSELARAGWKLIGHPSVLHVTAEIHEEWQAEIEPSPANQSARPDYLRPVPD